jgi:hypothetical protein
MTEEFALLYKRLDDLEHIVETLAKLLVGVLDMIDKGAADAAREKLRMETVQ